MIDHFDSSSVYSLQFPCVRLSCDNQTGDVWAQPIFSWRNWRNLVAYPWSICHPVTPWVADWGCILNSLFGATGPLGLHDVWCILGLILQLHWATLELLLKDGPGVEIYAQWLFGVSMDILPAWGYYDVPCLFLIVWFMRLLEFCDLFFGWSCNWWPPYILYFLEG